MIFAVFIGLLLGLRSVDAGMAVLLLAGALGAKLIVDVKWDRIPFLDMDSPYLVYCHRLRLAGETTRLAWVSYGLQLFVFGGLLGGTTYAVVSMFMA